MHKTARRLVFVVSMNAKTIAETALKVWGVLLVIGALLSIPTTLWMVWALPGDPTQEAIIRASKGGYVLNIVIQALGGVVLLVWADKIVALFESDVTPLHIDVSLAQVQVLAFAIVGVFVLIDGLQNAALSGYVVLTTPGDTDRWSSLWSRQGEGIIKGAVQISAGALLVAGREAFARGWSRLRGQPAPEAADAEDPR